MIESYGNNIRFNSIINNWHHNMMNDYFSVGEFCQTAHQIRRVTGVNEAYFFDWLVTRDRSYSFIVKENRGFLATKNWVIIDNGLRLLDQYSGLAFQHEFKNFNRVIDADLVEEHLETARNKFVYLKKKLILALQQSQRPVIILNNNRIKNHDMAAKEISYLSGVFHRVNKNIRFIVASTRLQSEEMEEVTQEYLLLKIQKPGVKGVTHGKGMMPLGIDCLIYLKNICHFE